ncbi:hypothetical protein CVO_02480 [Sulfurimonas sp. CVO]|uniref:hypothetical protein n=1 Tax=Sulfurimonas sp. CVO TaxID=2283483 RepID=UPI00132EB207|nr:hypothetical protein [Sulfurimonas sp. CVO]QHG90772.1 hypothetical protein CVO_02480 [Sulfurimonas sp. CVO]
MEFTDLVIIARKIYRIKDQKDKEAKNAIENSYEDDFLNLLFEQLKNKKLYVDSNIFMAKPNKAVDRFFDEFTSYDNIKITMPREQYEEIYNLKRSDEESSSKAARDAFRRIEKLVDSKHIDILDLKDMPADSSSYADPIFIKMIIDDLKSEKQVYFITEDKDLKIRLKSQIESKQLNENNIVICSFETLYNDKYNIVDEERRRIKKGEEIDEFFAKLQTDSLKDKMLDKVVSFLK